MPYLLVGAGARRADTNRRFFKRALALEDGHALPTRFGGQTGEKREKETVDPDAVKSLGC